MREETPSSPRCHKYKYFALHLTAQVSTHPSDYQPAIAMSHSRTIIFYILFCLAVVYPALGLPSPGTAATKLRQITRQEIVTRSRVQPAKRQTSPVPTRATCPNPENSTGTGTVYATLVGARPADYASPLTTAHSTGAPKLTGLLELQSSDDDPRRGLL